jgi:hypothetical protein
MFRRAGMSLRRDRFGSAIVSTSPMPLLEVNVLTLRRNKSVMVPCAPDQRLPAMPRYSLWIMDFTIS